MTFNKQTLKSIGSLKGLFQCGADEKVILTAKNAKDCAENAKSKH
jgi:hypothetical protein